MNVSDAVAETLGGFLEDAFGSVPQRASVTFLGVEPIDVLRFVTTEGLVYVTSGCARHPMSDPAELHVDPTRGPRAELVIRMAAGSMLPGLPRRLAALAAAPAVEGLVLSGDALVDIGEPLWDGSACSAVLLEDDTLGSVVLPQPMAPLTLLRAIPITANEAAWVRLKGAGALRESWSEAGIDVTMPNRAAATP